MKNCRKGFMMVEVMIALAILGGSALVLYGAVGFMNKSLGKVKLSRQSKDIVSGMINTFSTSAPILQVNYAASATFPASLPVAWETNGERRLVSECGTPCALRGRMGVLITPTDNKKLFLMKVRLTHPDWPNAKVSSFLLGAE